MPGDTVDVASTALRFPQEIGCTLGSLHCHPTVRPKLCVRASLVKQKNNGYVCYTATTQAQQKLLGNHGSVSISFKLT